MPKDKNYYARNVKQRDHDHKRGALGQGIQKVLVKDFTLLKGYQVRCQCRKITLSTFSKEAMVLR